MGQDLVSEGTQWLRYNSGKTNCKRDFIWNMVAGGHSKPDVKVWC